MGKDIGAYLDDNGVRVGDHFLADWIDHIAYGYTSPHPPVHALPTHGDPRGVSPRIAPRATRNQRNPRNPLAEHHLIDCIARGAPPSPHSFGMDPYFGVQLFSRTCARFDRQSKEQTSPQREASQRSSARAQRG
jgi:hypothetical protein